MDSEETILLPATYFDEDNVKPKYKRKVSNIFIDSTDTSANEFYEVTPDDADIELAGTNIEIDLRTGNIDEDFEPYEAEDNEDNNVKAFKKVRKQKPSKAISLEPEDTLVFDISQEWDDILKDDISNTLESEEVDELESEEIQVCT